MTCPISRNSLAPALCRRVARRRTPGEPATAVAVAFVAPRRAAVRESRQMQKLARSVAVLAAVSCARPNLARAAPPPATTAAAKTDEAKPDAKRSEERRVGKEGRSR